VVSIPDVEHWNVAALQQVFTVSQNAGKSLQKLGEGLDGTAAGLTDWMGPASDAWRSEHGKLRADVTDQHGQTRAVGQIVTTAIDDVQWCINELKDARAPAEALGMKVNPDGSVTDPNAGKSSDQQEADLREQVRSTAEARLKHLLSVAGTTETEVANGLRAAVGDPTAAVPANAPRPMQPATKPAAAGEQPKPGEKPPAASDPLAQLLGAGDPASNKPDPNSPWTKQAPPAQPDKPPTNPLDVLAGQHDKPGSTPPGGDAAGKPTNPLDLLAGKDGKPGADPNYTHNPLLAPIVKADPSVVDQQRAKVDAAQRAVDAAQAKVDASVNQAVTSGPYNGHDLNDNNPLARELFDARHNLTEQTKLLQDMNAAAAEAGGHQVPVPALPENADRQAFAPGPSLAERAATGVPEGLTTGSRVIHDITGGLVPDVAKGIHTGTHWGEASPADRAQLIGDAAGMVPLPGMKIAGEALEHGLAHYGAEALAHGAPPVVGSHVPVSGEHGGSVHTPDAPVSGDHGLSAHGGDAAPPPAEHHNALEDMLLGGHHDANPVEVPPTHAPPAPDIFDSGQGSHYNSGDPYHPGNWPPHTPESTWQKGDTEPGWRYVNRGPDQPWMDFQGQVGGVERTPDGHLPEYVRTDPTTGKPVDYDSHVFRGPQEVYLEAKDGHRGLAFAPDSTYWEGRADKTLDQVERQIRALPPDAILEWHVSDPYGAAAIRKLFETNGIYDVPVIFTPRVP
jgi:hypothetical protein